MIKTNKITGFIYCSRISSNYNFDCVANIIKVSRLHNKSKDITGILIFDGDRFYQYIEGPESNINFLIEKIATDRRHTDFTSKYFTTARNERVFSHWSMGYVLIEEENPFMELDLLSGEALVEKLKSIIPILDIA